MAKILRLILSITGAAAALAVSVTAGSAGTFGNAPWCAVQNLGAGDVTWDCEFPSAAACAPYVLAGNRGFCNINPRWASAPPAGPGPGSGPYWHHRYHHRHYYRH